MKTKILFLVFSLISLQIHAQLLWEVTGNGLENPSYVYGTVHVGDHRAYQFMDSIRPRMYQCDIMAGELTLDMSLLDNMQMLMSLFMPGDTTLRQLLSEKEYALVKRKMDKRLHNAGMIMLSGIMERIKPSFASILLMGLDQASQMKTPSREIAQQRPALDMYLQQEAHRMQKEVIGLETIEEQIGTFDQIPLKEQAQMLFQELNMQETGGESAQETLEKMLDWYADGQLDSLYHFSVSSMKPTMVESFLDRRNHHMADRMEPYLKNGQSMFVAVGAAHLSGQEGVLQLLRNKGYIIQPVYLLKIRE